MRGEPMFIDFHAEGLLLIHLCSLLHFPSAQLRISCEGNEGATPTLGTYAQQTSKKKKKKKSQTLSHSRTTIFSKPNPRAHLSPPKLNCHFKCRQIHTNVVIRFPFISNQSLPCYDQGGNSAFNILWGGRNGNWIMKVINKDYLLINRPFLGFILKQPKF